MERLYLNDEWKFARTFDEGMLDKDYDTSGMEDVRIPHTVAETPLHYFDEAKYQTVSCYVRMLSVPRKWKGKVLLLTIEGAAHVSEVFINGKKAGEHRCGYTAFTLDISKAVKYGTVNRIVVRLDSNESLNVPPFGFVIDYMTYGGIYRDVYLDVKEESYIADVFVSTKQAGRCETVEGKLLCKQSQLIAAVNVAGNKEGLVLRQSYRKCGGEYKPLSVTSVSKEGTDVIKNMTGETELWDVCQPSLYELKTELLSGESVIDEKVVTYGYRKAVFRKDGFYLNGKKVKIRGLNRHQSYPYVGYAMPDSMQAYDAELLKNELGVNAVRTSHYPQSHAFIDRCDELGLLVFTELPGWQHIGDGEWKDQAVKNVADMVVQYRNHPSIVLWGVRINESVDDDAFYRRTNDICRKLDYTRQTGGVRCYKNSNLLEDVYTYNDFLHSGANKGCDRKADVTSDKEKPYLISEYMGHMYPTKAFDFEEHRVSHAIRHATVLDEVTKQTDIAGSFGWCMFDYNTHKDFGSGDRICYHGVMDMFRNKKLAAAVYACQQDKVPVLEISSTMDIGEHPGCNRGETYIFTNADSVRMYKNGRFIKEYTKADAVYRHLKNAPIKIDDYIGDALAEQEDMTPKQAAEVKSILNEAARFGLYKLPKKTYIRAGKMMLLYKMKMDDAVALYNKYIGDWGGQSTVYRFEAVKDGKVVKTVTKAPMKKVSLRVEASHRTLKEGKTYDVAAVRIEAVDEYGNILPFYNEPVCLSTEGNISLIGPDIVALSGGMGGTYVKTVGKKGGGTLHIRTVTGIEEKISFQVE